MSEETAKETAETPTEQPPPSKKIKGTMEQAPASEWPSAWLMPDGDCADQKKLNQREPNVPVTVEQLQDLGIW